MGIELTAALVGFTLVGFWVDHRYGTGPWGIVVGAVLGLIGGMYNFLKQALRATRSTPAGVQDGSDHQDLPG